MGLARLHAANGVVAALPELLERLRDVQGRRRRDDAEIFALFGRPFAPLSHEESYVEASVSLRAAFGLDRLFTRQQATRVLVVAARSRRASRRSPAMPRPFRRSRSCHPVGAAT